MRWCTKIDKYGAWLDVWLHLSLYCKLYENFMIYPTVFLAKILSAISSQWENRKRLDQPLCVSYLSLTLSKVFDPFHHYPVAKHVEFMHNTEHLTYKMHFWAVSMWYCLKSKKGQMGCILVRAQVYLFFSFCVLITFTKKKVHHLYLVCVCNVLCHIFHRRPLVRKILKILWMTWIRLRVWNPAYARYYPGHWGGMDFWDIMRGGIVRR